MRKILIVVAVLLVAIIGGAGLFIATFDPNSYKGWIESAASDALGKAVRFDGPIELSRSLTPKVVVNDVVLQDGEQVVSVGRAEISLVLPAVIRGQVHVPRIAVADVVATLPLDLPAKADEAGDQDAGDSEPFAIPRVDEVELSNIQVAYQLDADRTLAFALERGTVRPDSEQTQIDMVGSIGEQPFGIDGSFGTIEDLFRGLPDLPATLSARLGPANLTVDGRLSLLPGGRGIRYDLAAAFRATELGELVHALGAPPLALESAMLDARLVGDESRLVARFSTFAIDDTETQAEVAVQMHEPRLAIVGEIQARNIDLTPFVPAERESAVAEQAKDEATTAMSPFDVALPGPKFVPVDLDLRVAIERLVLPGQQLEDIQVHAKADVDGIDVVLHPLSVAGATVSARLVADAREHPAPLSAHVKAGQLDVGKALAAARIDVPLSGIMDFELNLNGRGKTVEDLLSALTGNVEATGRLAYEIRTDRALLVSLDQATLGLQPDATTTIEIEGSADEIPFQVSGESAGLAQLLIEGGDLRVNLDVRVADASLGANGTVGRGEEGAPFGYAFDLAVDLPAPAKLAVVAGAEVPALPPTRVSAHIRQGDKAVLVDSFALEAGQSEVNGGLTFSYAGTRSELAGAIDAPLVDLAGLLPAGDTGADEPSAEAEPASGDGRVIPAVKLPMPSMIPIDLRLAAKVDRVVGLPEPIENIEAKIVADARRLTVSLDSATVMQGAITAQYAADATETPPEIALEAKADHLDLGEALSGETLRGEVFVTAQLNGRGTDLREFLAGARGRIEETTEDMFIANSYAEMAGRSMLMALLPSWKEEPGLEIYCSAIYVDVGDGKARTAGFVIDGERLIVGGGGGVDLVTEEIDFLILPEAKRQTIAALVAPVRVEGTLAEPNITPDATDFVLNTTASVALGVLLPVTLVIPIVAGDDDEGKEACIEAVNTPGKEPKSVFARTGDAIGGAAGAVGGAVKSVGEGASGLIKDLFGQ